MDRKQSPGWAVGPPTSWPPTTLHSCSQKVPTLWYRARHALGHRPDGRHRMTGKLAPGADTGFGSPHSPAFPPNLTHTPSQHRGMIYFSSSISYSTREPASWIISYSSWIFMEDSKMRKEISASSTAEIEWGLSLEAEGEGAAFRCGRKLKP